MKHTKGPWEISDCGDYIIGDTESDVIEQVADLSNSLNLEANARLISASPEMLAALLRARNRLEKIGTEYPELASKETLDILKNVIKKAKGK